MTPASCPNDPSQLPCSDYRQHASERRLTLYSGCNAMVHHAVDVLSALSRTVREHDGMLTKGE